MTTTGTSPQDPNREPEAMGEVGPTGPYKAQRPGAVSILAVLQLLGGIGLTLTSVLGSEGIFGVMSGSGPVSQPAAIVSLLLGMLQIAAGIGMWLGKRWGWWLAAFFFVTGVLGNASDLLAIPGMVEAQGEPYPNTGLYVLREVFQLGLSIALLIYWFRERVLDYFGLLDLSRLKAIAGLVAVAVLVVGGGYLLGSADRELDRIATIYEGGDLVTAIDELEQFLESHPDDDMAWTILGHARQDAGAYEDAEAAYDRAIEINPERYQAWTGLGILNRIVGDEDRALECYETALEINSNDPDAHSSLATLALQLYQDDKALEHAEKAYELDKRNPVIAANLAVVYHYHGMHERRDEMTAEAEKLGYEDVDILQLIYEGEWSIRE